MWLFSMRGRGCFRCAFTVTGGSIPLNINDTTTTSSGTSNVSYMYGDLLSGGTAPVEQITTTGSGATAVFLVANQTGVQGVYGSTGTSIEQAQYSLYGKQTITTGSDITPFGFQGSYTDSTGLVYFINRYYDPGTDQFLSIDSEVAISDEPYTYVNDDPLNFTDPLGLKLAGSGSESCEGTAAHLSCNGASSSGVSVAATINTKSAQRTIVVGTTRVTVSTSVTVTTRGSSKAPTVTIDRSGGAAVTLPGYAPITASSNGAVQAALGNSSGGSVSVGTNGLTYTTSIPPATIGGSNVDGNISAAATFSDDTPSTSGAFDWLPAVISGLATAGDWYLSMCAQTYGLTCAVDGA
ncbi:MAG: RHS repeat-associated core domain-containing protein [Acidimicrobiales bacterium]